MVNYTLNLTDPVIFSDENWMVLGATLEDAWEFLRDESFTAAGNCIRKALDLLDDSRMQRTDGFVPQGTTVGQATLDKLASRLEHTLALAYKDVPVALDSLGAISATISDLYFEQNDGEAIERCREHRRYIYQKLPAMLSAIDEALLAKSVPEMYTALKSCVETIQAVHWQVNESQYTTVADDQVLTNGWRDWLNFALARLVLGNLDSVHFALKQIKTSAAQQAKWVFSQ